MKTAIALSALAAIGFATAGGAAPNTKVFVMSTTKTDTPAKKGEASSEAAAWARALETFTAQALTSKFPCSSTMTPSDVGALMGHERDLQLLGAGGDPATLASLANSMDAAYLIGVTVTQLAGRSTVTMTVIDARTAKVLSRTMRVIPVDGGALDALEDFANRSVAGIGGPFIKCGPAGWKGTINVTITKDLKGKHANGKDTFTEQGNAVLECNLSGEGSKATCSYNSTYQLQGSGVTLDIAKTAAKSSASASASLSGGKLSLQIGVIPVTVVTKNSLAPGDSTPSQESITNQSFEVPAAPNPKSQSGTWTDPNPVMKQLGATVKVDWSLTRE
jgi:hypothetical protein